MRAGEGRTGPGMRAGDVQVEVVGESLRLSGEKRDERASTPAAGYHLRERHFGKFTRSFGLPEDVDPEQISARFEQGVLIVTLPRRPGSTRAESHGATPPRINYRRQTAQPCSKPTEPHKRTKYK